MKAIPDISVITVNFNGLQETRELLCSLRNKLHTCTYEVIVVDNGSSHNEASTLQQEFPEAIVIRSEQNRGFAGGNNIGLAQAQGRYLLLLNNDTLLQDDSLHYLCHTLESNPRIGGVSPKIADAAPPHLLQYAGFTPLSKYTLRNRAIGFREEDRGQYDIPGPTGFLHGAAMMLKRETFVKTGKMPEIYFLYYEEMDWCSQMKKQGYQLWTDPRCTVYHKESCTTGKESPLKTYYLHRNRLLYAWRNRQGIDRWIALFYQLCISNPKNIIINLLKGKIRHVWSVLTGSVDFLLMKNKMTT